MPNDKRISLVIPALNEEQLIEINVREFIAVAEGYFSDLDIILVDDGSTDKTGQIMDALAAADPRIRALHNRPNKGLGWSYRRGVSEARFEYVMMLCGDGGLPAQSLPPIFEQVGKTDIVIPYMSNMEEVKTGKRKALSSTYTTMLNLLFGQRLRYYNGLQVHRLDLLRQLDMTSVGFAFQGEILVKLLSAGASYIQVETLAAEKTQRSAAVKLKNFVDVGRVLLRLMAYRYLPNTARRRLSEVCASRASGDAATGTADTTTKPIAA